MLLSSEDTEFAVAWFDATHDCTEYGWRRTALPAAGGMGDQDAHLMDLIETVRDTKNALLGEAHQEEDARRKREAKTRTPR